MTVCLVVAQDREGEGRQNSLLWWRACWWLEGTPGWRVCEYIRKNVKGVQ